MALVNNEIGLGWDHQRGTIEASPDWWHRKLQITPQAVKFRTKGPILVDEQARLFSDVVANGVNSWTPSSGILPVHEREGGSEEVNLTENEIEDANATHVGDVPESNKFGLGQEPTSLDTDTVNTTYEPLQTAIQGKKSRKNASIPKLHTKSIKKLTCQQVVRLVDNMVKKIESFNQQGCACCTKNGKDSLDECLGLLDTMEGIEEGGDIWMCATRIFLKPSIRALFLRLKKCGGWKRNMPEI